VISYDIGMAHKLSLPNSGGRFPEPPFWTTVPVEQIEDVVQIWKLVRTWKNSTLEIVGEKIDKKQLTFHGLGCYRKKLRRGEGDEFCFGTSYSIYNIWGCRGLWLSLVATISSGAPYASQYTEISKGVLRLNKNALRTDVEKRLHEFRLCPLLDAPAALAALDALPEIYDPWRSELVKYNLLCVQLGGYSIYPVPQKFISFCAKKETFTPSWAEEHIEHGFLEPTYESEKQELEYKKIMKEIIKGLKHEPEEDIKYLIQQSERYKTHIDSMYIARTILDLLHIVATDSREKNRFSFVIAQEDEFDENGIFSGLENIKFHVELIEK